MVAKKKKPKKTDKKMPAFLLKKKKKDLEKKASLHGGLSLADSRTLDQLNFTLKKHKADLTSILAKTASIMDASGFSKTASELDRILRVFATKDWDADDEKYHNKREDTVNVWDELNYSGPPLVEDMVGDGSEIEDYSGHCAGCGKPIVSELQDGRGFCSECLEGPYSHEGSGNDELRIEEYDKLDPLVKRRKHDYDTTLDPRHDGVSFRNRRRE